MKKLLVLALALASLGFVPVAANAKSVDSPSANITANAASAQVRIRIGQPRRNRRVYRNYGQWRRNQMRNQRSVRYVTRTYWRNGRRYTRTVRVY